MRPLRALASITAAVAYAVIVIGFIVRITGSGMGCGPDWPLCNGAVIPAFTGSEVVIEWTHRVAVLALSGLTLAVVAVAYTRRSGPGGRGAGGTWRPALWVLGLFVIQSLVGRQAVRVELESLTVVIHLGLALALLAVLIVLGLRAGVHAGVTAPPVHPATGRGAAWGALALGSIALLLGGLTVHLGATGACTGFPLCSGRIWPDSGLAHLQWTHRVVAYLLLLHSIGLVMGLRRRATDVRLVHAGWMTLGLVTAQVAIAAVMVLAGFPAVWRALHAVVGTGLWVVLIYLGWLTTPRRGAAG
jgi:heme A synthase